MPAEISNTDNLTPEKLHPEIIAENDFAVLVPAKGHENRWLVVPKEDIRDPQNLPDNWWGSLMGLVVELHLDVDEENGYNISINIGAVAGQRQPRLHFWVVPRHADEGPSAYKGLVTYIDEANT